jgi:hypothetical protein
MADLNVGVLEARLTAVEREYIRFGENIAGINSKIDDRFSTLSSLIAAKGQTNWGILASFAGLLITVIGALGGLALLPVYNLLEKHSVIIEKTREAQVPRGEMTEMWKGIYRETDNLRSRIILETEGLQRQIDEAKRDYKTIYSAPDALRDIGDRLKRLEESSWRNSKN